MAKELEIEIHDGWGSIPQWARDGKKPDSKYTSNLHPFMVKYGNEIEVRFNDYEVAVDYYESLNEEKAFWFKMELIELQREINKP